ELVVISDFQRGSVDSSALRGVPDAYGVRFVRVAGSAPPDTFAMEGNGTGVRVRALADRTEMSWQRVNGATGPAVPGFQLRASASSRTRALAAYAAAMEVVGAPRADLASAGTGVSSLDRLAPNSGGITAADALVQIVYADAQGDTIRSSVLGAGVAPLTSAWMADVVVRIAADPLLREVAREGVRIDGMRPAAAISRITGTTADTTRFVVVTTSSGEPLVQAAQDSSGGTSRLLLFCLADAGSAVSTALIAATSRALESSGGDSATSVGGVSHAASMHDMTEREPLMMPDAELQRFNRVPADSAASATAVLSAMDAEQGSVSDARWFWGLALLLMAVEALMRRGGGNA
ncbi:MAG TPA: hypothetical protein VE869_15725, partial [Gemmatimonas sp.]|nr:hypothetical protein [Gemmatimonas sp.]